MALDLLLRDDDLDGAGRGVRADVDGVSQQANRSNDLPDLLHLIGRVRRIANHSFAACGLIARTNADDNAVLVDDLIGRLVQHVRATVDRTQTEMLTRQIRAAHVANYSPCETLRQFTETVQRVQVRRFAVARQGFTV